MTSGAGLPSFSPGPNTPALSDQEARIAIRCSPSVSLARGEPFALHGAFSIPKAQADRFPGHLLEAATVLLRGPMPATRSAGHRELLFAEDVHVQGDWVRGYFSLDLFLLFDLVREPNRYWVNASIFQYVSETVTVEVNP